MSSNSKTKQKRVCTPNSIIFLLRPLLLLPPAAEEQLTGISMYGGFNGGGGYGMGGMGGMGGMNSMGSNMGGKE